MHSDIARIGEADLSGLGYLSVSLGMSIMWIAIGVVLVVWGLASDTTWFKWFLIIAGALTVILQGIVVVRRWTSRN